MSSNFKKRKNTSIPFTALKKSKTAAFDVESTKNLCSIEAIINNRIPHVGEQIFENQNTNDLIQCLEVSRSWKSLAENVLLKRCNVGLSISRTKIFSRETGNTGNPKKIPGNSREMQKYYINTKKHSIF